MTAARHQVVVLALATALLGCGGSLAKNSDGSTTAPCSSLGACECMASDRCAPAPRRAGARASATRTSRASAAAASSSPARRGRWSRSARTGSPPCSPSAPASRSSSTSLTSASIRTRIRSASPVAWRTCRTPGRAREIDCSFCPVCDCAAPATPSPFAACLAGLRSRRRPRGSENPLTRAARPPIKRSRTNGSLSARRPGHRSGTRRRRRGGRDPEGRRGGAVRARGSPAGLSGDVRVIDVRGKWVVPGLHRPAHAPARARPRVQGRHRDRARAPRPRAGSPPSAHAQHRRRPTTTAR